MRRLLVVVAAVLMAVTAAPSASAASASATPSAAPSAAPSASAPASAPGPSTRGASASAQAVNPICDAEILDTAGVLSGDDVETVRSDASDLTQTTLLRIRVLAAPAGGDLTAYGQQLVSTCGWSTASDPYLLVLVATDGARGGIVAAPALTALSPATVSAIVDTDMRGPFARDDWAGGLGAALASLDQLVGPAADPSASFVPSTVAGGSATVTTAAPASGRSVASPAADSSSGGLSGLTVLLLVVAGLVLVVAVVVAVRRRSLAQPLAAAPGWPESEPAGEAETQEPYDPAQPDDVAPEGPDPDES